MYLLYFKIILPFFVFSLTEVIKNFPFPLTVTLSPSKTVLVVLVVQTEFTSARELSIIKTASFLETPHNALITQSNLKDDTVWLALTKVLLEGRGSL